MLVFLAPSLHVLAHGRSPRRRYRYVTDLTPTRGERRPLLHPFQTHGLRPDNGRIRGYYRRSPAGGKRHLHGRKASTLITHPICCGPLVKRGEIIARDDKAVAPREASTTAVLGPRYCVRFAGLSTQAVRLPKRRPNQADTPRVDLEAAMFIITVAISRKRPVIFRTGKTATAIPVNGRGQGHQQRSVLVSGGQHCRRKVRTTVGHGLGGRHCWNYGGKVVGLYHSSVMLYSAAKDGQAVT